jgi:hypothetical protein
MERGELFVPPTNVWIVRKLRHFAAMLLALQVIDVNFVTHAALPSYKRQLAGLSWARRLRNNAAPVTAV